MKTVAVFALVNLASSLLMFGARGAMNRTQSFKQSATLPLLISTATPTASHEA